MGHDAPEKVQVCARWCEGARLSVFLMERAGLKGATLPQRLHISLV